jgi:hypothetical protein
MGTTEKRMDKIAKSLTPEQALIAWLEEAQKFESVNEYAMRVIERPEDFPHLGDIVEQVELAVSDRTQGEPEEKVRKAIRNAVREASFLYFLHFQVNRHFCSVAQAMSLRSLLLLERSSGSLRNPIPSESDADGDGNWRDDLRSHALEAFTLNAAIEQLSQRYFDNHQILWRSAAEQLKSNIEVIYWIKNRREDLFYFANWKRSRGKKRHPGSHEKERPNFDFDLELLKESIDPKNAGKFLVDLAYAETLEFMGDRKGALKFTESLVRSMT